ALPWYVLVQMRNPQFFGEFILRQNFARFGTNLYQHHKPIWFYIPVLLGSLLPWSVLAICSMVPRILRLMALSAGLGVEVYDEKDPVGEIQSFDLSRLLILWATIPIAFFTLAQSKLPGYILPAIPAWTILVADYLQRFREATRKVNFAVLAGH